MPTLPGPTAFGSLLKRLRVAAGLTQETLAERAGLSVRAISDLERGVNRAPHDDTLQLLVEALSLHPADRAALIAATQQPADSSFTLLQGKGQMSAFEGAAPAFVGRRNELAALDRHLAGEGPPILLLAGEPGIGKSRLLREATQAAPGYGLRPLEGGCQRSGQDPYQPIVRALSRYIWTQPHEQLRSDLQECAWLTRLLPEVHAGLVETAPGVATTPDHERRLIFDAVRRFLTRIGGPAGVLLALDDLQWAGPDALDLIATLAHDAATIPLRIVATYRDTESPRGEPLSTMVDDLARERLATHLRLNALAPDEADALLRAMLVGLDARPERFAPVVQQVLRRAEGAPFFLVSWAQGLRTGALSLDAPDAVPADVAQSIRQRVDALPPVVRELLGAAAVIGRRTPRLLLLAVARELDYRERKTLDALEAAVRARLLLEDGEDGYQFAHDLVREVIGQDLSAARRAALHRHAARRLEAAPSVASPALIASHYLRSDEPERAFTHLLKAAEHAHTASAYREETAFLGDAITLASRQENPAHVADLYLRRARAFLPLALWSDADHELDLALAILPPEEKERRIQILLERAQVSHWLHGPDEIRRYARPALELADESGRDDLAAQAMCRLALADSSEGKVRASVEEYERAFARAGEERLASVVAGVEYSGLDLYWLGEYKAAVARGRQAVALARETQEIIYLARGLGNLGLALTGDGQYDEALRVFEEARQFARGQQLTQWLARATTMRGGLYLEVFDYQQAEAIAEEAREIGRSCGWPQAIASAGMDLLLSYARRGEADGRVERILPEVVKAAHGAHGEHGWLWRLRLAQARAEIALAREQWEEALRHAEDALTQGRKRGRVKYQVAGLKARAEALICLNRHQEALSDLRAAVALARPVGDPAMLLRASAPLLALDGDDALLAEARAAAERIADELHNAEMRAQFQAAAQVRALD
ncbi:MAG TPA: AAA family ATPase [Ktedonobacterales bacterium]|jgi:transcriptional regulator with XRE-family HTH domain/tetratricopeptide (TPR) repeat protein|nr:AAA family ATPase [Ktedonobacterales bacterium]